MMLQNQAYQEQLAGDDLGQLFTPAYIFGLVKRRALYFLIPFILVFAIGAVVALAWPAKYLAEGKILVQSQEIPADLVRPTVVSLANERIQVIEQRIMTRDNLLAIAKKFQISKNSWQSLVSGTEIVDFVKERARIRPLVLTLGSDRKQAIAFTVGFEHEQPQVAMRVANELVTMILNEDVRARTAFANETTKFLERDVQRLETQISQLDAQIAELRKGIPFDSGFDEGRGLVALKAELLIKSANLASSHPEIRSLKRKIEALENSKNTSDTDAAAGSTPTNEPGLGSLETRRNSLKLELSTATQKLSVARLGENLERGQHSERLQVLEQPTLPQKPVSPNRPKIFIIAFMAALMAGGGLAFAAEISDQSVRRSSDLYSIIDSHLIVAIPYIATRGEVRRKKRKTISGSAIVAALIIASLIALLFILPPLDIVFTKLMSTLAK
jgi:uncharacterized protein involved in exopolysaccharide biosynthesis